MVTGIHGVFLFVKYFLIAAFAALSFASFGGISDADAQSRTCKRLHNQLAALDSRGSGANRGSKKYRQYTDAIRKQQIEISKAAKVAKRNRCTSRGLFKNRSAQCKRLVASLKKMQANLRKLQQTRSKHAPKQAGNSRKRNAILVKLKRNRCDANSARTREASAKPERKSRRRTLIEQVFGVRTYRDTGGVSESNEEDQPRRNSNGGGATFRTLCVRKTDGYYFPISFSTTKKYFERDEEACKAMCPGIDVGLYHHRMPSEDSESMIAYGSDFPYAKEKFAFAYRKSVDRGAQCNFAVREDATTVASNGKKPKRGEIANGFIGIPEFKTDRTYAPDDVDAMFGRLSIKQIEQILIAANQPKPDPAIAREQGDRKIRIVGPAFYPVQ